MRSRSKVSSFRTDSECRCDAYMNKTAELARNGYLGPDQTLRGGRAPRATGRGSNPTPMPVPDDLDYEMWPGPAPDAPYTPDRVHPVKRLRPSGLDAHPDYCEGIITNWGTHLIDVAQPDQRQRAERPGVVWKARAIPRPRLRPLEHFLDFQIHYRYADGVVLDYKMDVPYLRVEGEDGWIQAHLASDGRINASDPEVLQTKLKDSDVIFRTRRTRRISFTASAQGTRRWPTPKSATAPARWASSATSPSVAASGWNGTRRPKNLSTDPTAEPTFLTGTYRKPWKL